MRALRAIIAAAVLAIAAIGLTASPAAALTTHPLDHSFSIGPNCGGGGGTGDEGDLGFVESTQLVYVYCPYTAFGDLGGEIKRFDLDGNPVPFPASEPYINGNAITGTPNPASTTGEFGLPSTIAVDNSSVHNGYIFIASYWGA